jgi:hypothetical protein
LPAVVIKRGCNQRQAQQGNKNFLKFHARIFAGLNGSPVAGSA